MGELEVRTYKAAIADIFTRTSESHDTVGTPLFAHFGPLLVDRAELRAGDRVLDVAAGAGASLFPAADRVGDSGRVIGIDLAPGWSIGSGRGSEASRVQTAFLKKWL